MNTDLKHKDIRVATLGHVTGTYVIYVPKHNLRFIYTPPTSRYWQGDVILSVVQAELDRM